MIKRRYFLEMGKPKRDHNRNKPPTPASLSIASSENGNDDFFSTDKTKRKKDKRAARSQETDGNAVADGGQTSVSGVRDQKADKRADKNSDMRKTIPKCVRFVAGPPDVIGINGGKSFYGQKNNCHLKSILKSEKKPNYGEEYWKEWEARWEEGCKDDEEETKETGEVKQDSGAGDRDYREEGEGNGEEETEGRGTDNQDAGAGEKEGEKKEGTRPDTRHKMRLERV